MHSTNDVRCTVYIINVHFKIGDSPHSNTVCVGLRSFPLFHLKKYFVRSPLECVSIRNDDVPVSFLYIHLYYIVVRFGLSFHISAVYRLSVCEAGKQAGILYPPHTKYFIYLFVFFNWKTKTVEIN